MPAQCASVFRKKSRTTAKQSYGIRDSLRYVQGMQQHAVASTSGNHDALPSMLESSYWRYTNDVGNTLEEANTYLSRPGVFSLLALSCALACDRCGPVGTVLSQSILRNASEPSCLFTHSHWGVVLIRDSELQNNIYAIVSALLRSR